jgi:hypothetical protein
VAIWAVSVKSESSDDYGEFLFNKKPTDAQLRAFFEKAFEGTGEMDCEDGGPGEWGSNLHISKPRKTAVNKL